MTQIGMYIKDGAGGPIFRNDDGFIVWQKSADISEEEWIANLSNEEWICGKDTAENRLARQGDAVEMGGEIVWWQDIAPVCGEK